MNHWQAFAEFARNETAVGGPDPQLPLVAKLSEGCSWQELVWHAGCYIGVYNVPCALALFTAWPWEDIAALPDRQNHLEAWLRENWDGIVTRKERRCVRRPEQLARYLDEYADWAAVLPSAPWMKTKAGATYVYPTVRYEAAWLDCQRVYTVGRYVALKLLEFLRRYCDAPIELPDLRARGGWSPREALSLLFPEDAGNLQGDESVANLQLADGRADELRLRLEWDHGVVVDRFQLQVLLCEYKQSAVNRKQYPGRSHDSELTYFGVVAPYWSLDGRFAAARAALFPRESLGEVQGWPGVREPLGAVLTSYSYTWGDLEFDYLASVDDLAHPVRRT